MSINNGIRILVNEIRSTREYKELLKAKSDLNKFGELKQQIKTLQKKQVELYKTNRPQREIERQVNEINKQYKNLSKIEEVDRFMKAAENFNKMMSKIYQEVIKQLDLDL